MGTKSLHILLSLVLLLSGPALVRGQVADSASWRGQGTGSVRAGKILLISGGAAVATGGGIMLLAMSVGRNGQKEQIGREDMATPVVVIGAAGAGFLLAGAAALLTGIPLTIKGSSINKCDGPWRDARYDDRGLGIILEGGYYLSTFLQARASVGYHFGPHIFLGGGIAPGFWLRNRVYFYEGHPPISLPVYADFRWSMSNRLATPYLGVAAGYDITDPSPYLGGEIGLRVRTSQHSLHSFWMALSGEVAADARVGIKMGYSF